MAEFNSYMFWYKRHLTLEQAEQFKQKWDYAGKDEVRESVIQYKAKTNDYTVRYSKHYNS